MINIATVIQEFNIGGFVLLGEPTNEDEFNSMFRKVIGEDETGSAILSDNPQDWGITWQQIMAKKPQIESAQNLQLLREERDRRIAETDWWVLPDRTPTQAQLDYRQALRDITNTYTSLDDVIWPEKP